MTSVLQDPTLVTLGELFLMYIETLVLKKWPRGEQSQIDAQWHMAKSWAWLHRSNFQQISFVLPGATPASDLER